MQTDPHRDFISQPPRATTDDPPGSSTTAPRYVNWVESDRDQTLALRSEQDIIEDIRHDQSVSAATDLCRQALRDHGRDAIAPPEMQRLGKDGKLEQLSYYQIARTKNLTAAIFPTQAPEGTRRQGLSSHATGFFVYDLDQDVTDVEELKAECIAWSHTRIAATSVSWEGLWLVVSGPVATNREEHKAAHEAIIGQMPEAIRRHIAMHQGNLDRLRYISSDPDAFYNPDAPTVEVGVNAGPGSGSTQTPPSDEDPGSQRPQGWPVKAATAREKARKILQRVKLPDDSYPIWVANCFSLIDGDRIYGADFDGRGVFVEWTAAAAYSGSTKPGKADAQYTRAEAADRGADPGTRRRTLAALGKGDGKPSSQSQQHQDERDAITDAINDWIDGWVKGDSLIFWTGRFRRKVGCVWRTESDQFFRQDLQRSLAKSLGDPRLRLVRTDQRSAAIESLRDAVSPPVVSELLLAPNDYLKNYDLLTGRFLDTTAFENGVVELDPDASHGFRLVTPDHWHYHHTHRPYPLPQELPPEPEEFNQFLEFRWPEPKTRLAIRQLIGATILQRLADENRFVFLKGPGGAGKGTLTRILDALIGSEAVFAVPNVARLASSQFALSQLETAALLLVSDPTDTATRQNRDALSDGLSILRSMTGQDKVPMESKGKDQYTARVNASVWITTNFPISDWVTGDADRDSWKRRLMPIPCTVQLPENKQHDDYEKRFVSEYPAIAWHCIAAYAEMRHSHQQYSWSREMLELRTEQIGGHLETINKFTGELRLEPGTWTGRRQMRAAYCRKLKCEFIPNGTAQDLYRAVEALPNVAASRRSDEPGFLGVACP